MLRRGLAEHVAVRGLQTAPQRLLDCQAGEVGGKKILRTELWEQDRGLQHGRCMNGRQRRVRAAQAKTLPPAYVPPEGGRRT